MARSKAATVNDWFAQFEPIRAPALREVRASILEHFGAPERMSYGVLSPTIRGAGG